MEDESVLGRNHLGEAGLTIVSGAKCLELGDKTGASRLGTDNGRKGSRLSKSWEQSPCFHSVSTLVPKQEGRPESEGQVLDKQSDGPSASRHVLSPQRGQSGRIMS